jgi:hypothetical protein
MLEPEAIIQASKKRPVSNDDQPRRHRRTRLIVLASCVQESRKIKSDESRKPDRQRWFNLQD